MKQNMFDIWGKYMDTSNIGKNPMGDMSNWMTSFSDLIEEWNTISQKILPQTFFNPNQMTNLWGSFPITGFPFQPDMVWRVFGIVSEKEHKDLVVKYEEILKKIDAEKKKNKNQEKTIQQQKKDIKSKSDEIQQLSSTVETQKLEIGKLSSKPKETKPKKPKSS